MENLDGMNHTELTAFWAKFNQPSRRDAEALFGGRPKGYIRAAKDCANYAMNRATAMFCRSNGVIDNARAYERIADRIYDQLPDFARW